MGAPLPSKMAICRAVWRITLAVWCVTLAVWCVTLAVCRCYLSMPFFLTTNYWSLSIYTVSIPRALIRLPQCLFQKLWWALHHSSAFIPAQSKMQSQHHSTCNVLPDLIQLPSKSLHAFNLVLHKYMITTCTVLQT